MVQSFDHYPAEPVTYRAWGEKPDGTVFTDSGTSVLILPSYTVGRMKELGSSDRFTPNKFQIGDYAVSKAYTNGGGAGELDFVWSYMGNKYHRTFKGPFPTVPIGNTLGGCGWDEVPDTEGKQNRLLAKAFAKIGKSVVSGGEDLGELKETIQMLKDPLRGLRDLIAREKFRKQLQDCIRYRKRPKYRLRDGKNVADTWLEVRYGLRPLMSSIASVAELVMAKQNNLDPNRIKTTRKRESWSETDAVKVYWSLGGGVSMTGVAKTKHELRAEAIVYFKQVKSISTSRALGLSVANIPETAWALTRASFILDWFLDVGTWIESFRVQPEFQILGSSTSVKIVSDGKLTPTSAEFSDRRYKAETESYGNDLNFARDYFRRTVRDVIPPALPQLGDWRDWDLPRILDSLALIYQPTYKRLRGK